MRLEIIEADLSRPEHASAVVEMTNAYARDPMGGGSDLSEQIQSDLPTALNDHPTTIVFLAFVGAVPVGIANCFLGFSTFSARPLLNVHDLAVLEEYRNKGIAKLLLQAAEQKAIALNCCKLTLEVLERNEPAIRVYAKFGFEGASDDDRRKLFLAKSL